MRKEDGERRSFLKKLVAGTAVTAAAISVRTVKATERKTTEHPGETLYRETEDFKNYYESLR